MANARVLLSLVLLTAFLTGCATSGDGFLSRQAKCAIVGGAVGSVIGVLAGDATGGIVGGTAGLLVGGIACDGTGDADGDGVPDGADQCPDTPAGAAVDTNGCPKDTDGDGVPDYKDQCPTPAGVKVDEWGCAIDSDSDGVSDADDQCPNTPPGTLVDEFGCGGDSDGDGVSDDRDQCPNTPKGWKVDGRGCPIPIVFRNVNFAFDSAALNADARKTLDDKAAAVLRDNPVVRVRIVGHTDSIGSDAYNQGLSERRARSVADYLFTRGVTRDRMEVQGKGESDPVAPNSADAGRAANRRVELFAVK